MPHPLMALVLSMTSTLGAAPSSELSVRYEQPGSPRAEQARKLLKDSDALETGIRLPAPIKVVARDCDSAEATWDQDERRITICYQLVDQARRVLDGISETEETDAGTGSARMEAMLSVLFHQQLGHALTTLNGLPDSDAQADQFAALTLPADAPKRVVPAAEARHLLAGHSGIDELSATAESATFSCLLYGADPGKYHRIAQGGWVAPERAPSCADEYNRVKSAIGSMAVKAGT
ncbi:DUF4344 domain-containing metallopeptidase [Nonomuraea sp. NPDC049784]|uniref:DUF4344 domain-containing metallopeptidase n=1 Tax=Nonomuraea sp. NPDC049784 TaxID=3154361 RepID=UPI0033F22602